MWFYVSNALSAFGWHQEDDGLYACNFLLGGTILSCINIFSFLFIKFYTFIFEFTFPVSLFIYKLGPRFWFFSKNSPYKNHPFFKEFADSFMNAGFGTLELLLSKSNTIFFLILIVYILNFYF